MKHSTLYVSTIKTTNALIDILKVKIKTKDKNVFKNEIKPHFTKKSTVAWSLV